MVIFVLPLFLNLLIVNILDTRHLNTDAHPINPENDWISVHRHLNAPDTIHFTKCLSPLSVCSTISDSSIIRNQNFGSSTTQHCSCQCKADAAAFLPSIRSCVNKLDECRQQIPFQLNDDFSRRWLPAFSIPARDGILAPTNKILWDDVLKEGNIIDRGLNCFVRNVFVQTDDLWTVRSNTSLFKLESYNRTKYLMWKGSERDAKRLEGSIVQLKIACSNNDLDFYCIAFRIAGVHVNANLAYQLNDIQWNRVELIICLLLATLLIITLFGGIALWKVCWKSKKSELISSMQLQFLYHMKQQQVHMQEQIASIKASFERYSSCENEGDQSYSNVSMQKRRLYFSADFFEPELMVHPPLPALQFVHELRKMIDIAKDRIRMKRHVPTLTTITEENENDEYLEMPRPPSRTNERTDEPSPKSLNSADSGCDSMSDDDSAQNQQVQGKDLGREQDQGKCVNGMRIEEKGRENYLQLESSLRNTQQCIPLPSKIPVISNSLPRSTITKAVPISRIPTIASSRLVSSTTPSPRLFTKSSCSQSINATKALYDKQNGVNTLENAVTPTTSKLSNPLSVVREPPDLERILSNVPPPLPETTPPSASPPCRSRSYSGRRRTYAVFPNNDLMLQKSLPRRSKRQQRSISSSADSMQTPQLSTTST